MANPSDQYRIDGHKLIHHPDRTAQWLEGRHHWDTARRVYPLYLELSPSGTCNHRCLFCAMDYLGYKPDMLDPEVVDRAAPEMARLGVKSVLFSGEGEPLLNRRLPDMVRSCKEAGIDVALATNAVLLTPERAEAILPRATWIKASIAAATPATYAAVHRTAEEDFPKVLANLRRAAEIRRQGKLSCTLGAQILLLPQNGREVSLLARICRDDLGLDYLVVKPYSQHAFSHTRDFADLDYSAILRLAHEAEALSTDGFRVIVRQESMEKHDTGAVPRCSAVPFLWAHVMANHDVYACSSFLGDERFRLGNLARDGFQAIWEGERRRALYETMKTFDMRGCRVNCRMRPINEYLLDLDRPGPADDFVALPHSRERAHGQ